MQDEEMICRIQNGDNSALNQLIEKYYNEVYLFLCRKIGNHVDAQDLTQIVFVKFIGSVYNYREKGKLRNYLFKLAVNASNDFFRKSVSLSPIDILGEHISDDITLEKISIRLSEAEAVKKAIQGLPPYQRDVIVLRVYHNLSFNDIAKITNSALPSVKSRYRQGIKKLKKLLEEVYFYE